MLYHTGLVPITCPSSFPLPVVQYGAYTVQLAKLVGMTLREGEETGGGFLFQGRKRKDRRGGDGHAHAHGPPEQKEYHAIDL